jgi:hypothetical protein
VGIAVCRLEVPVGWFPLRIIDHSLDIQHDSIALKKPAYHPPVLHSESELRIPEFTVHKPCQSLDFTDEIGSISVDQSSYSGA